MFCFLCSFSQILSPCCAPLHACDADSGSLLSTLPSRGVGSWWWGRGVVGAVGRGREGCYPGGAAAAAAQSRWALDAYVNKERRLLTERTNLISWNRPVAISNSPCLLPAIVTRSTVASDFCERGAWEEPEGGLRKKYGEIKRPHFIRNWVIFLNSNVSPSWLSGNETSPSCTSFAP